MPPVGFEPTIPASTRTQTYALDRAATVIGAGWFQLKLLSRLGLFYWAINVQKVTTCTCGNRLCITDVEITNIRDLLDSISSKTSR
jgi:hypothetical protein